MEEANKKRLGDNQIHLVLVTEPIYFVVSVKLEGVQPDSDF